MNRSLSLLLLALQSASAHANVSVIDQFNYQTETQGSWSDLAVYRENGIAQTFTVGRAGLLSQIDIHVNKTDGLEGTALFSLLRVSVSGVPLHDVPLVEMTLDVAEFPNSPGPSLFTPATTINLSSYGIAVRPGDQFAIALERDVPGGRPWVLWSQGEKGDVYTRGSVWNRNLNGDAWQPWLVGDVEFGGDMEFATYVQVPEPTTLLLASLPTALLGSLRRQRLRGNI